VASELAYLAPRHPYLLMVALLRTMSKAAGYQLGLREALLGNELSKKLSLHKSFWDRGGALHKSATQPPASSKIPTSGPVC
jgi:hypothetical protein